MTTWIALMWMSGLAWSQDEVAAEVVEPEAVVEENEE